MKNDKQRLKGIYRTSLILLVITLCVIMLLNAFLIRRTESDRIEMEGQIQLSSIAGSVDNSLYRSECLLNSVALQIEQIVSMGGDADKLLTEYFTVETVDGINSESDGSCFNAYAAYNNKLYISDFVPDDSFVLDERSWYVGAKRRLGAINVTDPYVDASTGEMCYSMSKLLSDGVTVVGLDFNMSGIQNYIERMNPDGDGTGLIVSGNGMIVGHSDPSLVGSYSGNLEFYNELVNKVFMLYGDSFNYKADGVSYNIFSDKTNYDWYLIVSVRDTGMFSLMSAQAVTILAVMLIFSITIVVFFIYTYRSKQSTENALHNKNEFLKNMVEELKHPLSDIINRADILGDGEGSVGIAGTEISDSARELNQKLNNLISVSAIDDLGSSSKQDKKKDVKITNHKGKTALITVVLFATSVFAVFLNTFTQVKWGDSIMQKETEVYLNQVQDWVAGNKAVLEVISQSIAAQPGFEEDYDKAVTYLDNIVSKYDDISVAYLCNPEWEHTVLMNNRWEPDYNWHVEERQWYIDTLISKNNFNISEPYLDEQTGYYCTTLSTVVYDSKGNFIGLLGIDYYLDKLIGILGASYTDTGYAFLTDIDGNILNHPYADYQMKPGSSVNAANLCYRDALSKSESMIIKDYDNKRRVCLAMTEENSGFKVIVIKEISEIYGKGITSDIVYICVFALCIIIVNVIMRRLNEWQSKVNIELKEAAESAISAGKAKNNFLANMSHEIRTPINAVLGMNEMIMRESGEKPIIEYASSIQSSGRTLLSIINDILDFSKIESGMMEIVPVEYDVSSLFNDIISMIKPRAEKKSLAFITEIDENIPAVLYGDDVRIRQIITNITTNAVKYTLTGSVRLKVRVQSRQNDRVSLEVTVSDTGIGIREEDISKLFKSFQRLDQERNRNIEGTGLGITIVQRLLDMMGSRLEVSSVYGEGSTFSFVIEQRIVKDEPLGDFEKRFQPIAEASDNTVVRIAPNARILVVDDNETNLIVAKSLLKRTQVQLETAISGKGCIELLKSNAYDIVFLDHMMPNMDGIETLHTIMEQGLGGKSVFVALTANAIHGARQLYMEAGFDDYLSKPFTGSDIERCLFGHLDSSLVESMGCNCDNAEELTESVGIADIHVMSEAAADEALLSTEKGLFYSGGDHDAYIEILDIYVRNHKKKSELIGTLFAEKRWKDYVIEVHALKSSSLTIGAEKLSELARELELSGKAGSYRVIEEKNSLLLELYGNVAIVAGAYLDTCKPEDIPQHDFDSEQAAQLDYEQVRYFISEIKAACSSFDGDRIIEICDKVSGYTIRSTPLKPLFDAVRAAAYDFEFEEASEKADMILEILK